MQANRKISIHDSSRRQIAIELSRFLTTDHTDTIRITTQNRLSRIPSIPYPLRIRCTNALVKTAQSSVFIRAIRAIRAIRG